MSKEQQGASRLNGCVDESIWLLHVGSAVVFYYFFLHLPSEASSDDFIVHFSSFLFTAWG